jgi:hypothetical protein
MPDRYFWYALCEKKCSYWLESEDPGGDPRWPKMRCRYDETRVIQLAPQGTESKGDGP